MRKTALARLLVHPAAAIVLLACAGGTSVAAAAQGSAPSANLAKSVAASFRRISSDPDFVEIKNGPAVQVALRYATTNNFTHTNLYGGFHRAYLRRLAAQKFDTATAILEQEHPGWKFLIWDALRPRAVQWVFWNHVKGTPREKERYVANPATGSIHNFGCALDLTLIDEHARPLDMGTDFDDFSAAAEPELEQALLRKGRLTPAQIANRRILRGIMTRAGFIQLPQEWWHYDALPAHVVKSRYKIVE